MYAGSFVRSDNLARLRSGHFDVVVVGGGVTGAGVALDAAARGLSVALVDKGDWASGTSSKSSKMVHGGLRYLQNGDVHLVYEALRERQRLMRNAPHLVSVLPFLIPMFAKDGVIHPKLARALGSVMWMYDLTGGARIGKLHRRISAAESMEHMPTLRSGRVAASYLYYDAQADDARLTMTIARTAALRFGAVCVNHCPVIDVVRDGDRVRGVVVDADGDPVTVRGGVVVNATGVWADTLAGMADPVRDATIRPAKGVHVTVPWDLVRNRIAVVVPVPGDRRSVFVVPWPAAPGRDPAFTYIGTTDTDYHGPLDEPSVTDDDIDYLLGAINRSIDGTIARSDIVGAWAGLRPLVRADAGRTADLSRTHSVTTSASGMVTVTGGKLTTYRQMAQDTVDAVVALLAATSGLDRPSSSDRVRALAGRFRYRSRTASLRLFGARGFDAESAGLMGHLQRRHGGDAVRVMALMRGRPDLSDPLVPGLPYVRAEAVHAVRAEMAASLDDVLARRTRALLLDRAATLDAAPDVAALIGPELGWDEERTRAEVDRFVGAHRSYVG